MDKTNIIFGAGFSAFAVLIIIVGAVIMIQWFDFKKDCKVADGIIVDIRSSYNHRDDSTDHDVIVEYIVDDVVYTSSLGYYTANMRVRDRVSVNYDPDDPSRTMASPGFAVVIMLILILAFGGVGGGFLIYELRHRKLINGLIAEGKYIVCDSSTVREEKSANVTVNHVRYMQTDFIYCAPDGQEYRFSSRAYHPNKNPFIDGQNVIVYVDIEKNPKKYYVSEGR